MQGITSVLLDLDGTLIDSQAGIIGSYRAALRGLGHEPDPAIDLRFVIGPVLADVMGEVLAHYGDTRVSEAILAYRRHYEKTGILQVSLYDGVATLLARLKTAGVSMLLATSKRTIYAARILDDLELTRYFDGIYGSEPDGFRDHKPELIADILTRRDLKSSETVMVGDRRYDITGAHANGLRAIGVLWGYGSQEELEAAGADLIVTTPEELADTVTSRSSESA